MLLTRRRISRLSGLYAADARCRLTDRSSTSGLYQLIVY